MPSDTDPMSDEDEPNVARRNDDAGSSDDDDFKAYMEVRPQSPPPVHWPVPFMSPDEVIVDGTNGPIQDPLYLHRLDYQLPEGYEYGEADFGSSDDIEDVIYFSANNYQPRSYVRPTMDDDLIKWVVQSYSEAVGYTEYSKGPNFLIRNNDGKVRAFYGASIFSVTIYGSEPMRWALATFKSRFIGKLEVDFESTMLRDLMFKAFFRHAKQVAFVTAAPQNLKPLATLDLYYRFLNIRMFFGDAFEPFMAQFRLPGESDAEMERRLFTDCNFHQPGWRKMRSNDLATVHKLLLEWNQKCGFKLTPHFPTLGDLKRLLMPAMTQPPVFAYVFETRRAPDKSRKRIHKPKLVGFVSFYMSVTFVDEDMFTKANLYYHVPVPRLSHFYDDVCTLARRHGGDLLATTGAFHMAALADDAQLVRGGKVHYCVTNWRCKPLLESEVGLILV